MKHGHAKRTGRTRTYRIWKNMLGRARGKQDPHNYAGRGIGVHPTWEEYSAFLADMGECPLGLTLDRINNDGNYEPGNCRWAPRSVQARNNRRNRWVELCGQRLIVKDAAAQLGVRDTAIINIVKRRGLTYQEAVDRLVNGIPAKQRDSSGRYIIGGGP